MGAGDGLGGCYACIKYVMFAFNFIFWLIGCALVGVGIWVLVDENFKNLAEEAEFGYLQYAGITFIVIGGIVMVVGFFGCCGAIRESQCLLVMFFICMLLLFLALVTAGVACLIFRDQVADVALELFDQQMKVHTNESPSEFVDLVQATFQCCGNIGAIDYNLLDIPDSCKTTDTSLLTGCSTAVPETLDKYIAIAAGVALGAGAVMLIGMIFSMLLCCAIRDQDR